MRPRLSPAFVVAVLALVLAAGGTGYAAGKITSRDIKDGTVQGRDVKNESLTGRDVKDRSLTGQDVADGSLSGADVRSGSIPRTAIAGCATGEVSAFGGCVRRAAFGPSSYQEAVEDCNRRNGRIPTIAETRWIATHDEFTWADGNQANYEFTGEFTSDYPVTPIATDQFGSVVSNAFALSFWHHCITS